MIRRDRAFEHSILVYTLSRSFRFKKDYENKKDFIFPKAKCLDFLTFHFLIFYVSTCLYKILSILHELKCNCKRKSLAINLCNNFPRQTTCHPSNFVSFQFFFDFAFFNQPAADLVNG